jgi:hypothetical protein
MIPKVENFLCCLKLETGGITIGILTVIFSAYSILLEGLQIHRNMPYLLQDKDFDEQQYQFTVGKFSEKVFFMQKKNINLVFKQFSPFSSSLVLYFQSCF